MSALPSIPRITQRVIRKPFYRNENIHSFGQWYRDNEPALVQYWDDLCCFTPEPETDQQEFFASQYDQERLHHDLQQHEAQEETMRLRELGWSPYDRDTGIPKYGEI